jgi:hypothetical protein
MATDPDTKADTLVQTYLMAVDDDTSLFFTINRSSTKIFFH